MKTSLITILGALTALGASIPSSHGAITSFVGEDLSPNGNFVRMTSTPNHDQAQASFLAALTNSVAANSFETGFADDQNINGSFVQFVTPSGTVTAAFAGTGSFQSIATGTNGVGRYPSDGSFFIDTTSGNFTLALSTPINAFGFTGIDIGDFAGQVTLILNGGTVFNVPHTAAPTGSIIFFGFISDEPISTIQFGNSGASDFFSIDELIIATSEQIAPDIGGVPEPTTALFGLALVGAVLSSRRRRAALLGNLE